MENKEKLETILNNYINNRDNITLECINNALLALAYYNKMAVKGCNMLLDKSDNAQIYELKEKVLRLLVEDYYEKGEDVGLCRDDIIYFRMRNGIQISFHTYCPFWKYNIWREMNYTNPKPIWDGVKDSHLFIDKIDEYNEAKANYIRRCKEKEQALNEFFDDVKPIIIKILKNKRTRDSLEITKSYDELVGLILSYEPVIYSDGSYSDIESLLVCLGLDYIARIEIEHKIALKMGCVNIYELMDKLRDKIE